LSHNLEGIVGDDLDSKKATAFKISWAPDSVSVNYETPTGVRERKDFTIEKLQQLALEARQGMKMCVAQTGAGRTD
jgi:hypothetical protein